MTTQPLPHDAPALDLEDLVARCGDDRELALTLLLIYEDSVPLLLARIEDGLRDGDAGATGDALHALAGAVANVGGRATGALATTLRKRIIRDGLTGIATDADVLRERLHAVSSDARRAIVVLSDALA